MYLYRGIYYNTCMKFISKNVGSLSMFAREIKIMTENSNKTPFVLFLSGDLGSGKTTFTQELLKVFGVTESVVSPTYVIAREYKLESDVFTQCVHVDAYRLEGYKELEQLGFSKFIKEGNLVIMEWPEQVCEDVLAPDLHIYCDYGNSENERTYEIR